MPVTVFHRGLMRSLRVIHLLLEMDVEFDVFMLKPFAEVGLAEQLRGLGMNIARTLPVIRDDDGFVLFESAAIASYLTERYRKTGGRTPQEKALCTQWLAFAETLVSLGPRGILSGVVDEEGGIAAIADKTRERFNQRLQTLELHFSHHASDFLLPSGISAGDCAIAYTLTLLVKRMDWDLSPFPRTKAYFERMIRRSAYQEAWKFNNDDLRGRIHVSSGRNFVQSAMLTTKDGTRCSFVCIGGKTDTGGQPPSVLEEDFVETAFHKQGVNSWYFNAGCSAPFFCDGLRKLAADPAIRPRLFVIANGGSPTQARSTDYRTPAAVLEDFEAALEELQVDYLDAFVLQYIQPYEDEATVLASLDMMQKLKAEGRLRYVVMSTHSFGYAEKLIASGKLDAVMLRYNMAHRSAEKVAFPLALQKRVPVLAFTATRWHSLQSGHHAWQGELPTTADCISYALSHPAVEMVISSLKTKGEVEAVVPHVEDWTMGASSSELASACLARWTEYGKVVYEDQGGVIGVADKGLFEEMGTEKRPVMPNLPGLVAESKARL